MEETATEVPPVHYTTSQLVKMVMDKTGMPCKSRNRSALLKKLGLPAEKSDPARNPVKTKAPTVRQQAKASRVPGGAVCLAGDARQWRSAAFRPCTRACVSGAIASPSARMPRRRKAMASRIPASASSIVVPVATQPGRSGTQAKWLPPAFSITTAYFIADLMYSGRLA